MKRYLVVANQTAAGPTLLHELERLMALGDCEFTLVVPATRPEDQLMWTEGTAYGLARRRLEDAVEKIRALGAAVQGWVGDEDPYRAIADALLEHEFDEVVLSTFPQGISRWLRMDVASRVQRDFGIPVRVVHADRVPVRAQR